MDDRNSVAKFLSASQKALRTDYRTHQQQVSVALVVGRLDGIIVQVFVVTGAPYYTGCWKMSSRGI